ncbi:hypothetical protein V8F20_009398 [Naviculisporaceae sp. PSN 640]
MGKFLASTASPEFLRNLPEVEQHENVRSGSRIGPVSSSQGDPSSSPTPRHSRFLILEEWPGWVYVAKINQRVTLTLFLAQADKHDEDSLTIAYRKVTGEFQGICDSRLERTLVGRSVPSSSFPHEEQKVDDGKGPTIFCKLLIWKYFEDPEGDEERFAHNEEFKQGWEEMTKDMKAMGWMTAWKQERWDFRLVPGWFREDSDDEEEH